MTNLHKNIYDYYSNDLKLTNPLYIYINDVYDKFDKPHERPLLKDRDVVFYSKYGYHEQCLYNLLMYAVDDGATSVHIFVDNDTASITCNIDEIIKFNRCRSEYHRRIAHKYNNIFEYRYKPFESVMFIDQCSFIPREFDRLIDSLTMHAFNGKGELVY